jgi:hypothetical protein
MRNFGAVAEYFSPQSAHLYKSILPKIFKTEDLPKDFFSIGI